MYLFHWSIQVVNINNNNNNHLIKWICLKGFIFFVHNDKMFKQKFTKKYHYNNPTDGQETQSLGMEQGVRNMHGRNKPALKHSRACEEEQGMSLQSTRSGSPSFEGRHARRQQGLHRQDQHSRAHKEFMPWIHPVRHRGQDVPTAPAAAWDSCGVEHHPCSHSLSRPKLGRGMGMCQGVQGSYVRLWRVVWGEVVNYFPIHTSHCQSHVAKFPCVQDSLLLSLLTVRINATVQPTP